MSVQNYRSRLQKQTLTGIFHLLTVTTNLGQNAIIFHKSRRKSSYKTTQELTNNQVVTTNHTK